MNAQSPRRTRNRMGWLVLMMLLLPACQPMAMDHLQERHGRYYPHASDTPYSGSVVTYYSEDQSRVYQSGTFENGYKEGTWTINHWNGEKEEITFKKGVRHGVTTSYFSSGQVKQSQEYQYGIPHGQGNVWAADGRMIRHTLHEEGRLILLSESKDIPAKDHSPTFTPPIDLLANLFPPRS